MWLVAFTFFSRFAGLFSAYELGQGSVLSAPERSGDAEGTDLKADDATRILPACALLAANGGAFFLYAWGNFFRIQHTLQRGKFVLRGRGLVGLVAGSLLSSVFALLIVINPGDALDWRDWVHKQRALNQRTV